MAQINAPAATGGASSTVSIPAGSSGSYASDDCGHKIQISVGAPQPPATPSAWAAAADHVLAAPFLWSLVAIFVLIAWRTDLRRLLTVIIDRIESGDKIDIVGVKMEAPAEEPLIYTIVRDEEGSINGIDMEQ
jgi:hypothetical protein